MNKVISDRRAFLMGLALIAVVLYHQTFVQNPVTDIFSLFGFLGVDVFLFLSGFGIYHSQKHDKSLSVWNFYKRRFFRIVPTCIIGGIAFLYFWCGSGLYTMYGINYYSAFVGLDVWYIRTTLIYYLISPFLYTLVMRYQRYPFAMLAVAYLGVTLVNPLILNYLKSQEAPYFTIQTICWTINRFPAYLLGMVVAHANLKKEAFADIRVILLAIVCGTGYVLVAAGFAKQWIADKSLLSIIRTIFGVAILLPLIPYTSVLAYWLGKKVRGPINKCICLCGAYSLEIFLAHAAIFPYAVTYYGKGYLVFISELAFAICAAILLKKISAVVTKAAFGK